MPASFFRLLPVRLLNTRPWGVVLALWLAPLFFTGLVGCDSQSGNKTGSESATGAANTAPDNLPKLDSTAVDTYFRQTPALKAHRTDALQFYRERNSHLGWFKANGDVVPQAGKLLDKVATAQQDGLDPRQYPTQDVQKLFAALKAARSGGKGDADLADLQRRTDLALSGLYFAFAGDFYKGTVDPHVNDAIEWSVKRNKVKLYRSLQTILQERDSSYPYYEFGALHTDYDRLRHGLSVLRAVQQHGGWGTVPATKGLKPGEADTIVVPALRRRLLADATVKIKIDNHPAQPYQYDEALAAVVRAFQDRHGLKPDGVVGGATLTALNVPVEERIDQVILNMERWRWVPKSLGVRYAMVNIPDYRLHVIDSGREVLTMPVIVGKELKQTPVFSDRMKYVVLSPYWNLPTSIVVEEIKPAMLRNPNGLEAKHMEVLNSKNQPVPASSVNWAGVTADNWKHRIRQLPGDDNPLGPMKFIFPNDNDVYFHGTPFTALFGATQRGFSHGCVRLEDPMKLARYVLRHQPEWTDEKIEQTIKGGKETWIILKEELPVYLVYFTAWADADGTLHFRDDIYGHDKTLEKAYFG